MIHQLEAVFFEQGPPQELLMDNDPTFAAEKLELLCVSGVLTCFVARMPQLGMV